MKKWNVWEIEVKTGARRIRIRTYYGLTSWEALSPGT